MTSADCDKLYKMTQLEPELKKSVQKDTFKNTIDKLKWSIKIHPRNPQEGRKIKIWKQRKWRTKGRHNPQPNNNYTKCKLSRHISKRQRLAEWIKKKKDTCLQKNSFCNDTESLRVKELKKSHENINQKKK